MDPNSDSMKYIKRRAWQHGRDQHGFTCQFDSMFHAIVESIGLGIVEALEVSGYVMDEGALAALWPDLPKYPNDPEA